MFIEDQGEDERTSSLSEKLTAWIDRREKPFCNGEALWWERLVLSDVSACEAAEDIGPLISRGEAEFRESAQDTDATALCLSGGGIRSAAFSLGVVQALASKELLTSFSYLSTVSGGGYLGGFLQRWALGNPDDGRNEQGLERALARSITGETLPELDRLRDGTNFITPKVGAFSSDSWVAIATSLRNIFVNWLLFAPLFVLVGAVPALLYWFLMASGPSWSLAALGVHFVALVVAMIGVGMGLPTYRRSGFLGPRTLALWIVVPVFIAALMTLIMAASPPLFALPIAGKLDQDAWRMWPSAVSAIAASVAGLEIAMLWSLRSDQVVGIRIVTDLPLWCLSGAFAAAAYLGCTVYIFGGDQPWVYPIEGGVAGAEMLVIGGPALFIAAILIAGWTFSLFRGVFRRKLFLKSDLDREWLIRLSAIMIKPTLVWTCLASIAILAVFFDFRSGRFAQPDTAESKLSFDYGAWLVSGGFGSGLLGALAGKSGATWIGYVRKFLSLELIAIIGTIVFGVLVLAIGSLVANQLVFGIHGQLVDRCLDGWCEAAWFMSASYIAVMAGLFLFLAVFGRIIDVNRFSLNGFYRNRLARAFLGAARCGPMLSRDVHHDERMPDPFTGFDPADNVRLHTLWPSKRQTGRRPALFPVINVTLNALATKRLAWQERKALPFVLTPLACGSGWLNGSSDREQSGAIGAYVAANRYGGQERDQALEGYGVTLAAAMAISGAAATPNMGYHSSPATAFLMTLFNVRLGAWLPNPALWRPARSDNPVDKQRNSVALLLRELAGLTDDQKPDIYLSDGGHFENLGLYEMIRRRCSNIVVVDGGCDPELRFEDLGNALRKIAIDFNVDITFEPFCIEKVKDGRMMKKSHAVGTIHYPEGWKGKLLYLKLGMIEGLPLDVMAYAAKHGEFPHEPTTDQWFSESQFESYRRLGQHLVESICADDYSRCYEGGARIRTFIESVEGAKDPPAVVPIHAR
jgi:hypothetical protein